MFKDNLVSLRKMHGFSQDELSEKIGVSRQTLSKYETGESLPDIEKCKLLAEVLDVSLDDLVNYDRENSNNLGLGVPPKAPAETHPEIQRPFPLIKDIVR